MMKLTWVDGRPEWIPVTEQEDAERVAMLEAVRNIPEIKPEKIADNGGYIGKHGDNVSVYDAMMAEILGEHNAEKARVRNRRKADRKHKVLPEERKHREEMRKDRMFGYYYNENCPKVMFAPDSLPIKYRKDAESDRIARADWERDLAAWDYDIAYEEFNAEICREDICELNMEIQSLEYQLSDVEILRNRLENLRKERDVTEKYLRNSEEFLRKYMWVKEML